MEKTENKYQRGKIYKIISNQTNDVYYGSTIAPYLTNRLSAHRKDYKRWLNGDHYMASFDIMKFEDAKIILVENFPCNTKDELHSREQYYIDTNDCVNKQKAYCGLNKKEYDKQYRQEHKDKKNEYQRHYYENNKEKFVKIRNQYYERNKEKLLEQQKQYYEENKEEITCVCGSKYLNKTKPYILKPKNINNLFLIKQ